MTDEKRDTQDDYGQTNRLDLHFGSNGRGDVRKDSPPVWLVALNSFLVLTAIAGGVAVIAIVAKFVLSLFGMDQ